jgi:hypothetical protein
MMKVAQTGNDHEDIGRLVHAVNFSEAIIGPANVNLDSNQTPFSSAAGNVFSRQALAIDRSVFRELLPDARWLVYAAGFLNSSDGNTVTATLTYQDDSTTVVVLGSVSHAAGWAKKVIGPLDVFGTPGVPTGESVPMIRLHFSKATAGTGECAGWCLWLRLLVSKQ